MKYVVAPIAAMLLVLLAALYAGLSFLTAPADPELVVGNWQPREPVWPRPKLTLAADYPLPAVGLADGGHFTPRANFLPRHMVPSYLGPPGPIASRP